MPISKIKDKRLKIKDKVKKTQPRVGSPLAKKAVKVQMKKTSKRTGLSVPIFDLEGKKKGTVGLPREIFGAKINKVLMAQAIRVYLANQRQGTASTKTRGQVTGSTRKIYRQKGTGRARHGAITAPIFVGGGIVFGPSPRDFSLKLSKQMKKKALFSALSAKFAESKIFVVNMGDLNGKTKQIYNMLKAINLTRKADADKILFVADGENDNRASRNIEGLSVRRAHVVNTHDVLNSNYVIIALEALPRMESVFLRRDK